MNFKVAFQRTATVVESCEAVVEAASQEEAVELFESKQLKRFLVKNRTYKEIETDNAKFSRV